MYSIYTVQQLKILYLICMIHKYEKDEKIINDYISNMYEND